MATSPELEPALEPALKLAAPPLRAAAAPLARDASPLAPAFERPDATDTVPLGAAPAASVDAMDALPLAAVGAAPLPEDREPAAEAARAMLSP
jgi:hypothetical protein